MDKRTLHFTLLNKTQLVRDTREKLELLRFFQTPQRPTVISFLNSHAFNWAHRNTVFYDALNQSDFVFRDGFGVEIFMKLFNRNPGLNMNGSDLIPEIINQTKAKRIILCGTRSEIAKSLECALRKDGFQIVGAFDGFKEDDFYIDEIKKIKPDVIILGMGMPKQEILALKLKKQLSFPVLIINGGAILDFLSGSVKRAPVFIRQIRCEWIFRLTLEPGRLWKRYLIGNFVFLTRILSLKLGLN